MAMSANAARALEQVKMGLYMLYGADYFTQDEWIKIDGLIHKGKYVLTDGPPRQVLHEEELISFGESKDGVESIQIIQPTSNQSFERPSSASSSYMRSGSLLPAPPNVQPVDSTMMELSSPPQWNLPVMEGQLLPHQSSKADTSPVSEFSERIATVSTKSSPPSTLPPPQTSKVLPPGITQEQLDEARKMQAAMTKAGQKTRPKYGRDEEPLSRSRWEDDVPEEMVVDEAYSSHVSSERDNGITSWASEVNAQQDLPSEHASPALANRNREHFSQHLPSSEIASPTPNKKPIDPKVLAQEEYIKIHGRNPRSINDFYQPNNPNHFSQRSISRASNTTAKTTKTTKSAQVAAKLPTKINPRSTYIAQSPQSKTHGSDLRLDVRPGDHITAIKYVSGVMWVGSNSRTKLTGQFSENIFKKAAGAIRFETAKPVQNSIVSPNVTSSSIRNGLENVEQTNADEWDEVPMRSTSRPAAAPAPVRPVLGGLASSRFSTLADRDESKYQIPAKNEITLAMKKEFGKMVDEKVDEILKAKGIAPAPTPLPTNPISKAPDGLLKPTPPKKNTCWFWAKNKGCRFTAEECRDLHGYLPNTVEPTNLHLGRPTWGALADASPSAGHIDPDSFAVPQIETSSRLPPEHKKDMTCWYWAKDGHCDYTEETCKYLHEHTARGVAPAPWKKPVRWGMHTWRRGNEEETVAGDEMTIDGEGTEETGGEDSEELVLQEVHAEDSMNMANWGVIGDGGVGGWGRDTPVQDAVSGWGQDDRYKPPHVKALEEKAMIEAVGW